MARKLTYLIFGIIGSLLLAQWLLKSQNRDAVGSQSPADAQPTVVREIPEDGQAIERPIFIESATAEASPAADCDPDRLEKRYQQWEAQVAVASGVDSMRQIAERLSAAESAETLFTASMIHPEEDNRQPLLVRALKANPSSVPLLHQALSLCARYESDACRTSGWEQRLIALDSQNSQTWVRVAANHYANDRLDAALDALRRAASAAETNDFWADRLEIIERGLVASGIEPFPVRALMALNISVANAPEYNGIVSMCNQQTAVDAQWAEQCRAYGELAARQGRTALGVAIARGIQIAALKAQGRDDEAEQIRQRESDLRNAQIDAVDDLESMADLSISSPDRFAHYLAAIRADGENEALASLRREAREQSVARAADCPPRLSLD